MNALLLQRLHSLSSACLSVSNASLVVTLNVIHQNEQIYRVKAMATWQLLSTIAYTGQHLAKAFLWIRSRIGDLTR